MKQTLITLLILLFSATTASAQFGVKFESLPDRRPPLTKKFPIKAQFRLPFNDLDDDGTPDIAWHESIFVKVISGQSKETLWQQQLSALPGGGSVRPDVLGFVRSPSLDGGLGVMTYFESLEVLQVVCGTRAGNGFHEVLFSMQNVQLLAIADPDGDSFMDLVLYRPADGVILVVGETGGGNAATDASASRFSSFSSPAANSDFQLSLKFESEPDRELAYDLDLLNPPGALDIDGDDAMDIVMITEDANGDPAGVLVRDGGSHDVKWQFDFPPEHKDNIVTAFHGFFDVDRSGVKEAIVGANLAITADGTVHVIDDHLEILAVLDVDGDGFPELIGRGLADSTVQVWGAASPTGIAEDDLVIAGFQLQQNYPNPFNPTTTIRYSVERAGAVELRIYNMLGQSVKTLVEGNKAAGEYSVLWDGKDHFGRPVTSGQYFYRFKVGELHSTRAMILLK